VTLQHPSQLFSVQQIGAIMAPWPFKITFEFCQSAPMGQTRGQGP
jgi:hypothetical protein